MSTNKEEQDSTRYALKTLDGQLQAIQPEGSLGILALGYKGLLAWRKKRDLINIQKTSSEKAERPD